MASQVTESQLISVVEAVRIFQETQQFFIYIAIIDDVSCDKCINYDRSLMTRTEIKGTFDYLTKISDTVWMPNTHPNCRCVLYLFEDEPKRDAKGQPTVSDDQFNASLGTLQDELEDDEDLWDLVALGILDSVKKRKEPAK